MQAKELIENIKKVYMTSFRQALIGGNMVNKHVSENSKIYTSGPKNQKNNKKIQKKKTKSQKRHTHSKHYLECIYILGVERNDLNKLKCLSEYIYQTYNFIS